MQNGDQIKAVIDGKVRKFTAAEVLYESSLPVHCDASRWQELLIVRTAKDAIVMRAAHRTRWQGEHDSNTWSFCADTDAAAVKLASSAQGNDEDGVGYLARNALKELGWWDRVAEEV